MISAAPYYLTYPISKYLTSYVNERELVSQMCKWTRYFYCKDISTCLMNMINRRIGLTMAMINLTMGCQARYWLDQTSLLKNANTQHSEAVTHSSIYRVQYCFTSLIMFSIIWLLTDIIFSKHCLIQRVHWIWEKNTKIFYLVCLTENSDVLVGERNEFEDEREWGSTD